MCDFYLFFYCGAVLSVLVHMKRAAYCLHGNILKCLWKEPEVVAAGASKICVTFAYLEEALSLALYSVPQLDIASRIGLRLRPKSVRLYSTRGGTSA